MTSSSEKILSITNSLLKKNSFLISVGWTVDISRLNAVTISNIFMSTENVNRKMSGVKKYLFYTYKIALHKFEKSFAFSKVLSY